VHLPRHCPAVSIGNVPVPGLSTTVQYSAGQCKMSEHDLQNSGSDEDPSLCIPPARAPARPLPKIPPARPADRSASNYIRGSTPPKNPAGSPGGSFGSQLHPRLALSQKSRRLARRIVRLPTTSAARPLPKIPPARPADRSAPNYIRGSPSPKNPAGSPGGSFGFQLHPRLDPSQKSRRLARRIVRLPTTSAARPLPKIPPARPADRSASNYIRGSTPPKNPAGSPGGSFGFQLHPRLALSQKSRRLARRIVRLPTTSAARPLPKIPPARPADRSASNYIRGSTPPKNPAGSPGGSFGFRLQSRPGGAAPNQPSGDSRAQRRGWVSVLLQKLTGILPPGCIRGFDFMRGWPEGALERWIGGRSTSLGG
jgi:hypothetical protein